MIKNIIFDFGGVICDLKKRNYFYELGMDKQDVDWYFENVFRASHEDETLGLQTHEETLKMYCDKYPEKKQLIKLMHDEKHLAKSCPLRFNVLEYIADLKKQGFEVYGLTNLGASEHNYFQEQYFNQTSKNFDELFNGVIYSYKVKCRKPRSIMLNSNDENYLKIYKILLREYGLNPKESLFIDDLQVNVDFAEMVGIKGLQWTKDDNIETIKTKISKIILDT